MIKKLSVLVLALTLALILLSGCARQTFNAVTPLQAQTTDGISIYFPRTGQNPAPVLVGLYAAAQKQIDVAIYDLTRADVVNALIDAKKRGVRVQVITDREEARSRDEKGEITVLTQAGITVKRNFHPGLMHIKMSVIDGTLATTGSYNYTMSASERNDEMFVVVRDPEFVADCQTEFDRMWGDSKNFK